MPAHEWCAPLLGRAATQLRGDPLYTLPDAGPDLLISYIGLQVGLQLPTGRIFAITRHPRPEFGGLSSSLPPRAVVAHDFVYGGTLGSTSAGLSLEDMQACLGLLPTVCCYTGRVLPAACHVSSCGSCMLCPRPLRRVPLRTPAPTRPGVLSASAPQRSQLSALSAPQCSQRPLGAVRVQL